MASRHELVLDDGTDPDEVLKACFEHGIVLRSFDRSDPSLRQVFMALVKSQGSQAITQ